MAEWVEAGFIESGVDADHPPAWLTHEQMWQITDEQKRLLLGDNSRDCLVVAFDAVKHN